MIGGNHHSALYEGVVTHTRLEPRQHHLRYRVGMVHLDLGSVDDALALHPLAGRGAASPMRYRREDYHGDPSVPLDEAVRTTVAERLGWRPSGPVTMLAHLRTWGWCFNPITPYWCFDDDGQRVVAQVFEVSNTPWHERVAYAFDLRAESGWRWSRRFRKEMYVSPFLPMEAHYRARATGPGERLRLSIDTECDGRIVMKAGLRLERAPLDRAAISRLLTRYPLLTHRVSLGIHTHAARLWAKGVPAYPHARNDGGETHRREAA